METKYTWDNLLNHYQTDIKNTHLRELLQDEVRNDKLQAKFEDLIFDYTHEKVSVETVEKLFPELIENAKLREKLVKLFNGVILDLF